MITASRVSFSYGRTRVLHEVDLEVPTGRMLGLIGPNGSGKTTLLRTLYGAARPSSGTVFLDGRPVSAIPRRQLAREIAVVVQEAPGDLEHTVADTVLLGRTPHLGGPFARPTREDEDQAVEALHRVGAAHLAGRGLEELSGGEKQRVHLARALVQDARCLLLDEPTNHLDIGFQHQLLELVREVGTTTVVVLHDLNLAARYCDEIVLLEKGRVRERGTPAEVLTSETVAEVYGIGAQAVTTEDGTHQMLFHPTGRGGPR